jgi:hypothetical protein
VILTQAELQAVAVLRSVSGADSDMAHRLERLAARACRAIDVNFGADCLAIAVSANKLDGQPASLLTKFVA